MTAGRQPHLSDYEECRAEFEYWFHTEGLDEKYRADMWYSWRAGWQATRRIDFEIDRLNEVQVK